MRIYSILGGIAILVGVGTAAHFFSREYSTVLFNAQNNSVKTTRLINGMTGIPASYGAKLDILLSCDQAMSGLGFGLLVSEDRAAIQTTCRTQAERFLDQSPDLGFAHYVRALSVSHTPDSDEFSDALTASVENAQFVQWQAERRVRLATTYYDDAPDAARTVIQNDIPNLIRYEKGRALLIQLYLRYGSTEAKSWENVTVAIEQTSPRLQKKFISELRAVLNNEEANSGV